MSKSKWRWLGWTQPGDRQRVEEPLPRAEQEKDAIVGTPADISERKQADDALRKSESRYRGLFHGSPIALREEDYTEVKSHLDRLRREGIADFRRYFQDHPEAVRECAAKVKVLDLNQVALSLHGAASKEQLLAGLHIIFTDESYDAFREVLVSMAEGKTVFDIESPVRTLQGETRHIVLRWTVAPGSEESLARVYISQIDITDRKRAEEALRRSEELYRSIVENVDAGITLIDADHTLVTINPAQARMFGKSPSEYPGKKCYREFEKRDAVCPHCPSVKAMATGLVQEVETEGVRDDGGRFAVRLKICPVFGPDGVATGFIELVEDITKAKHAQALLMQAKEAAEAANLAKSEFLANMSHEIRTPMTAILGFSDLLTTHSLSHQERREFLDGIRRNGRALLDLINDILDLSRIEADRLTLEKVDCPLRQLVDDVMSVVRLRAEQKGLSLEVDYRYPLPETLRTDPARLRQILVNLMGNAVKFTDRGRVCMRVRWIGAGGQAARFEFAISDTGIGIPADKVGQLFQAFMQVDGSTTRRYGGTGLGLAISKRLANALAGDIQVTSKLGRGSTFTLSIDAGSLDGVRMLHAPEAESPKPDEPSLERRAGRLRGRILLAEDMPDVYFVLRQILRKMELEVDVAVDGRIACEMAEKSKADGAPYDLILMDIQMPEMNGYEATHMLREHGWQGPIVALTAYAMVGDREKCLEAGCDEYLSKPIAAAALRDVLSRNLPRRPAATEIAARNAAGRREPASLRDIGTLDSNAPTGPGGALAGDLPPQLPPSPVSTE